jgi:hypothetical protein
MFKVVSIDNMDQVMRKLTKIGKGNGQEVIVEARKGLRKVANGFVPTFKAATAVKTGDLRRSVKVKSSTKRGVTSVRVLWDQPEGKNYGSFVNFRKDSPHYRKISNLYKAYKWRMDQASRDAIKDAIKTVFEREGFTVK